MLLVQVFLGLTAYATSNFLYNQTFDSSYAKDYENYKKVFVGSYECDRAKTDNCL